MRRPAGSRAGLRGAAWLGVALAAGVGGGLIWAGQDPLRRQAVFIAAVASGTGGLGGWATTRWSRGRPPATAVSTGLAATLVRLAPMLATLAWVTSRPDLQQAGAGGVLVVFYLGLLATDLLLNIAESAGGAPSRADRRAGSEARRIDADSRVTHTLPSVSHRSPSDL